MSANDFPDCEADDAQRDDHEQDHANRGAPPRALGSKQRAIHRHNCPTGSFRRDEVLSGYMKNSIFLLLKRQISKKVEGKP